VYQTTRVGGTLGPSVLFCLVLFWDSGRLSHDPPLLARIWKSQVEKLWKSQAPQLQPKVVWAM
jgi:hypothetical protein